MSASEIYRKVCGRYGTSSSTIFIHIAITEPEMWHADLQWKLIYVGSAESEKFDQVLDDVEVGPVRRGKYKFVLQVCTFSTNSSLKHVTEL